MQKRKCAQKYQNKVVFKVRYNEHYRDVASTAAKDRLCEPCLHQVEWKLKFGKYKVPADLAKCIKCERKVIFKAYRKLCDQCSDELEACAKCMNHNEDLNNSISDDGVDMESTLKTMRERSRRMIHRRLDKDEIKWDKHQKCFIEVESGIQVEIKLKADYIDDEDEDMWKDQSEESAEEGEEQQQMSNFEKKMIQQKNTKQVKQDSESSCDDSVEVYTDGSIDLDKFNRKEKNFHFYFGDKYEQDYDN